MFSPLARTSRRGLDNFVLELIDEITGLVPSSPAQGSTVNDILINGHEMRLCRARGMLEPTAGALQGRGDLIRIVIRSSAVGSGVDETQPCFDARPARRSRINIAGRAHRGRRALVSIRSFSKSPTI